MSEPLSDKVSSSPVASSSRWLRARMLLRVSRQQLHIYAFIAVILAFVFVGGLRVIATPIADNQGGFSDEVFHFARSLDRAWHLAQYLNLRAPEYSGADLAGLGTRADDLCGLGISSECPESRQRNFEDMPLGSGEIRGVGVYLLHGVTQLLLPVSDIHVRLLVGRIVSLCMGLALVWVMYLLGFLLFDDRAIAVATAAIVVMLPSVSGLFSAISTEGPALLAVALVMLAAFTVYLRGFSIRRLCGLGVALAACIFTKITALLVLPVIVVLMMHRAGFRWRGLLLTVLTGIVMISIGFKFGYKPTYGAAYWYRERVPQNVPIHGKPAAIVEQYLVPDESNFVIPAGRNTLPSVFADDINIHPGKGIVQFLPQRVAWGLAGKRVSVGAWVIGKANIGIYIPEIIVKSDNVRTSILTPILWVSPACTGTDPDACRLLPATGEWQFLSYEAQMPAQVSDVGVRLLYTAPPKLDDKHQLWDGITLAVGSYASSALPPTYDRRSATTGVWGGVRFENMLKNGSFEDNWYGAPHFVKNLSNKILTGTLANRIDTQVYSILDLDRTGLGYINGLRAIFTTLFGSFAGGEWPGLARWHYGVVVGVLVMSGLGWWRRFFTDGPKVTPASYMSVNVVFALLLIALLYLLAGVSRMDVSGEWTPPLYYATARYVMPSISSVVFLTVGGITHLFSKRMVLVVLGLLISGVFLANTWMLLRVEIPYFTCPLEIRWACTAL